MLVPAKGGAEMRANPWEADLRPAPARSTVGLQHHHGEMECQTSLSNSGSGYGAWNRKSRAWSPTWSTPKRRRACSARSGSTSSCPRSFCLRVMGAMKKFRRCFAVRKMRSALTNTCLSHLEKQTLTIWQVGGNGSSHLFHGNRRAMKTGIQTYILEHRRSSLHQIMRRCRRVRSSVHENVVKRCVKGGPHGLIEHHAAAAVMPPPASWWPYGHTPHTGQPLAKSERDFDASNSGRWSGGRRALPQFCGRRRVAQ